MKHLFSKICTIILCLGVLAGSAGCSSPAGDNASSQKLQVVATIFPVYDWAKNILGDRLADADLTLLLKDGVDLHSYQPSTSDLVKISNADLFIYVGGESDGWVDDALTSVKNKDMVAINLMDVLSDSLKEEEVVEGMQAEEEEEEEEDSGHDEAPENDEHVWLSLRNAQTVSKSIADALCKLDSEHQKEYTDNLNAYTQKLSELDQQYTDAVKSAPNKTLLFGDRFPFRYMTEDYGLKYYAAFVGCSAESEASFETIVFLAKKVDELKLPVILTIDGNDHKIAKSIISNTTAKDQKILTLNSMQYVKNEDVENGSHYLDIMKENLAVLTTAMSAK